MRPVIGASVHYVEHDNVSVRCLDATITAIHPSKGAGTLADLRGPEEVDLAVLAPTGVTTAAQSRHSEGSRTKGTWHWPDD